MAHGFKLAIIYNSELLKYCVDLAIIFTSMFLVLFRYFLFLLGLFNDYYKRLHYIIYNDNERITN